MKKHILAGYILVVFLCFPVVGAVKAFFSDEVSMRSSPRFELGTVNLAVSKKSGGNITISAPKENAGNVTWSLVNTGSKAIKLRARIIEELQGGNGDYTGTIETAWAVGRDVKKDTPATDISPRFGTGNARYHVYTLGATEENPLELKLGYGANYTDAGSVSIWNDSNYIYVEAVTTGSWRLKETHLYVGSTIPTISAPGQLGNKREPMSNSVSYQLPIPTGVEDDKVYIALHAAIEEYVSGDDDSKPEIDFHVTDWVKGNDGYYYYLQPVPKNGTVDFPLTFDVAGYWSGEYKLYLEAQAVQASHNAINIVWPGNPGNLNDT